ncbi:MAG: phosphatidylglycerophosphatase A [Bacteroidales bacterium]
MILSRPRPGISPWHPAALAATWFGSGLLPKAPGTWGSLAALPFAWGLTRLGGWPVLLAASLACFVVGCWAAEIYTRRTGVQDPSEVVIDEVAGQWLVLAAAPADPLFYAIGFALFRVLDITKPWPARWADRHVHGGLGVMLDDMLAAAYGAAVLAVIALWKTLP